MRPIINAFVALTLLLPALALASATPQQVVEDTSRKVMEVLDANRETYRNDVEAFTVGLNDVLEPVVDFDGIARSVMNPHCPDVLISQGIIKCVSVTWN